MSYRTVTRGLATGLGCACLGAVLDATPLGRALDAWCVDACFVVRGHRPTAARVVIVAVDEATLDGLKKPAAFISPELARVVRFAERQGARAIGLDVLIPASLSGLREIEDGLGEARTLGDAVADSSRVVLPRYFDVDSGQVRHPLLQWSAGAALNASPTSFGYLNLTEDDDQFIRAQALVDDPARPDARPFFALALYARSRGAAFAPEAGGRAIRVGEERVPLDRDGRMRINFVGPPGSFPVLPLNRLLEAERAGRPVPALRDAVAIVALTGAGGQDRHPSPFANGAARLLAARTPGLTQGAEIHAHAVATLHDGAFLTRPWWVEPLPWALLSGAALGAAFARLDLSRGALALFLYLAAVAVAGYTAFRSCGWILSPVPLVLTAAMTYAVVLARRWARLRRMMAVVKSEAIARALEADPRRLDPGGELRAVSALFADIRSFTTFSERCGNDPHKVVALLNGYFGVVVPLIESEGGTVVTFLGDGVMALFGAPVSQPDHAVRAVRAAVRMAEAVRREAGLWARLGCAGMKIGVGVHTGPAVVGAVGGRSRLDYTAIGDTINTASRVEGQTKTFAAEVLITASTHAALGGVADLVGRCRPLAEPVRLAGKAEPVELWRVEVSPERR